MQTKGRLKWFDQQRGFGFIILDTVGDVLLPHEEVEDYDLVKDLLKPGVELEYFLVTRLRAKKARIAPAKEKGGIGQG